MLIILKSDAKTLKIDMTINWKSLRAMLKMLAMVITSIVTFLATPEIHRLGIILGWWK